MYVHPAFKADRSAAEALLEARGFGTLVAHDGARPLAVHAPFVFTSSGGRATIELHVARANPIHEAVALNPQVLVTCVGADAYISPTGTAPPTRSRPGTTSPSMRAAAPA